ncbi:hypothetical protein Tco_1344257 [Tanacetum coccineum]
MKDLISSIQRLLQRDGHLSMIQVDFLHSVSICIITSRQRIDSCSRSRCPGNSGVAEKPDGGVGATDGCLQVSSGVDIKGCDEALGECGGVAGGVSTNGDWCTSGVTHSSVGLEQQERTKSFEFSGFRLSLNQLFVNLLLSFKRHSLGVDDCRLATKCLILSYSSLS